MFKLDFEIKNKFYFILLTLFPIFYIVGSLFLNTIIALISFVFIVNYSKIKYDKKLLIFFFFIVIFFVINSIFSESRSYSFYKSLGTDRLLFFASASSQGFDDVASQDFGVNSSIVNYYDSLNSSAAAGWVELNNNSAYVGFDAEL